MLIDWFTVGAQMLNFLVLVWLMQRFLYKPILRAIDARERMIAQRIEETDLKKAEAQKERDAFRKRNEEFERQRAELLRQMNDEVESERFRLLNEARKASDDLGAKQMETLRNDARNLRQAISQRAQQEVFAIARKTLADLSSASLEQGMADVFVRRMRAVSDVEKAELKKASMSGPGTAIVVRSAFELPAAQRASIQSVIGELLGVSSPIRFETAPDLVGGIDLTAYGRKISWNIDSYIQALETGVAELLEVKGKPETGAASAPRETDTGTANS